MNISNTLKRLGVAASITVFSTGTSQAALLLDLDLSVANQLTITSTTGLSSATAQGNPRIYLQSFFATAGGAFTTLAASSSGTFTNVQSGDTSNGSIRLLRGGGADEAASGGLGLFNWTNSSIADMANGQQAFTGSATVTLTAGEYADLLNSNASGDIYFPAVVDNDVSSASVIGQYQVTTVPEPATTVLAGLGLGAVCFRRKRSK